MKRSQRFSDYHQHGLIIKNFYKDYFELKSLFDWTNNQIKKNKIIDMNFLEHINIIESIKLEQSWNNSFQQIIVLENTFKKFNFEQNKLAIEEFEKINEVEKIKRDEKLDLLQNQVDSYRYVSKKEKYQKTNFLNEISINNQRMKNNQQFDYQMLKNPEINLDKKNSKYIIFIIIGFLLIALFIAIVLLSLTLIGVL